MAQGKVSASLRVGTSSMLQGSHTSGHVTQKSPHRASDYSVNWHTVDLRTDHNVHISERSDTGKYSADLSSKLCFKGLSGEPRALIRDCE